MNQTYMLFMPKKFLLRYNVFKIEPSTPEISFCGKNYNSKPDIDDCGRG